MAPEYVHKGHFSIKSDVFSFGVLVLEIVTGIKNNQVHLDNEIVGLVEHVSMSFLFFIAKTLVSILGEYMKADFKCYSCRLGEIGIMELLKIS